MVVVALIGHLEDIRGDMRTLSNCITTSWLVSPRLDLSLTKTSMTYLSFSFKVGKVRGARSIARKEKASLTPKGELRSYGPNDHRRE
jgi:hypothetical protein